MLVVVPALLYVAPTQEMIWRSELRHDRRISVSTPLAQNLDDEVHPDYFNHHPRICCAMNLHQISTLQYPILYLMSHI